MSLWLACMRVKVRNCALFAGFLSFGTSSSSSSANMIPGGFSARMDEVIDIVGAKRLGGWS
jgi:hypothetical protein